MLIRGGGLGLLGQSDEQYKGSVDLPVDVEVSDSCALPPNSKRFVSLNRG